MINGVEWHRDCYDISYYQNKIERLKAKTSDGKDVPDWARYFYTISFSYKFKHDNDTVFFAHSIPYTF